MGPNDMWQRCKNEGLKWRHEEAVMARQLADICRSAWPSSALPCRSAFLARALSVGFERLPAAAREREFDCKSYDKVFAL